MASGHHVRKPPAPWLRTCFVGGKISLSQRQLLYGGNSVKVVSVTDVDSAVEITPYEREEGEDEFKFIARGN